MRKYFKYIIYNDFINFDIFAFSSFARSGSIKILPLNSSVIIFCLEAISIWIGSGAKFKGKITGAKALEINGDVEADIDIGKITIGQDAHFKGGIKADLAVISGIYEGTMQAESIWLTDTSRVSGEIRYQSLQMDRGAALNCRVVYNWDDTDQKSKKSKTKDKTVETSDEIIEENIENEWNNLHI